MDNRSTKTPSNGKAYRHEPAASSYLCLTDLEQKPWHSTPVTKSNDFVPGGRQILTPDSRHYGPHIPTEPFCLPSLQDTQFSEKFPVNPRSASQTIANLKKELQLLVTELKDRDKELNTMAAAHRQEVQTWERTRQKLLKLERQCAFLEDELQKRNDVIRVLTKHVVVLETREEDALQQLRESQLQIRELSNKELNLSKKCQDFEEQNKSLNSSVTALSTQIGALQVREEELSSMLKLKEKDVSEASSHLLDLTGHLKDMELSLKESYTKESTLQTELQEQKHYCTEARCAITQLKEQLQQQIAQSSAQREEIIRLKQELQLVSQNQALPEEGESSWKDELLELFRSKQERTTSELLCLRQVCENQRNDIQLLQLNLESARQSQKERVTWEIPSSQDYVNRRSMDIDVLSNCSLKRILKELDETSLEHSSCRQPRHRQRSASFLHKRESPKACHHHDTCEQLREQRNTN
ncbi:coiled-coil domain-containing protein 62 isoform X2 [Periophthalmus magnuspinnatus]|uniref:coiled-coil domain-containing protein 62 isoform X2 n=1 Tax=Periophthalmus magnuspinnatus TaxID=409849 RepID=UPI00243681AD|nr:coiled-coil domain-containing protein 62 isoform X2 [Periophthalmus magnuspinnatus]